jgi:hypothetical protein
MNRWDHFDVIVAVGICATILGASMFFFAFGGAPTGLLDQRFESAAPLTINPDGVAQAALGQAIVESGKISHVAGEPWERRQDRLGGAIVAAVRAEQARAGLMPYFRDEARESLARMQGMLQENAGRSVVLAAQRMWRDGGTSTAQIKFQETLGRIVAEMSAKERAAIPLRQEALGWTVVGRLLAVDEYNGHVQQQFGSAVRDAGVMAARLDTERPVTQESLGAAVLMAARSVASSEDASAGLAASVAGGAGAHSMGEVPYQAGVILFAALFVMGWGLRSVAETGPGLPTQEPMHSADGRYRKTG